MLIYWFVLCSICFVLSERACLCLSHGQGPSAPGPFYNERALPQSYGCRCLSRPHFSQSRLQALWSLNHVCRQTCPSAFVQIFEIRHSNRLIKEPVPCDPMPLRVRLMVSLLGGPCYPYSDRRGLGRSRKRRRDDPSGHRMLFWPKGSLLRVV